MILYKVNIIKHTDHSTIKSIEHVDNNYYYDNKPFFADCMFQGPDFPGGITNKGWTFNSEQNYYLIDIKSYNININNGGSYNNPTIMILTYDPSLT